MVINNENITTTTITTVCLVLVLAWSHMVVCMYH